MNQKIHNVQSVSANHTHLYLIVDGQTYRIQWVDCSDKLARASQTEREYIEVSPSGYGLHWPLIDEDLAITPLLQQAERVTAENDVTV